MRSLLLAYSLYYAALQGANAWSLNFGHNDQQLLNGGQQGAGKLDTVEPISSWDELETANYPAELKASLKDIAKQFPNGRPDMSFFQPSKAKTPVSRRPVKYDDNQPNYVATSDELPDYALRGKKVDLKDLGVDKVTQYAGYFDVVPDDRHLFYWFFESRNDPKNDPIILWLNGGPGCSSLTGLFFELGPSAVKSDGKNLHFNPYSWNSNASVIFLDQPVNTGFSYSTESGVYNSFDAGVDVYAFLQLFFQQFPQYTSQDFHIAGESYAGHYIPVLATEILKHDERNFNLSSILIGNGLTDGYTQYAYYEPMACGKGGYEAVLDEEECENMLNAYPRCAGMIKSCYETGSSFTCLPATIYCNNAFIGPYQNTGRNVYDIRGQCDSGTSLCYKDLEYIDSFLNLEKVKKALGVEVEQYEGCNFDVNRKFVFAGDWMKPIQEFIPPLLESGLPVLIYAGDKDFICNWLGNQGWTNSLEWSGAKQFRKASVKPWVVDGEEAGTVQSYGNFTFLRVYEAGHMVPYDQPENALSLVNTWISRKGYA